jgi:hypothetical protein
MIQWLNFPIVSFVFLRYYYSRAYRFARNTPEGSDFMIAILGKEASARFEHIVANRMNISGKAEF